MWRSYCGEVTMWQSYWLPALLQTFVQRLRSNSRSHSYISLVVWRIFFVANLLWRIFHVANPLATLRYTIIAYFKYYSSNTVSLIHGSIHTVPRLRNMGTHLLVYYGTGRPSISTLKDWLTLHGLLA